MVAGLGAVAAGIAVGVAQQSDSAAAEAKFRGKAYSVATAVAGLGAVGSGVLGGVALLMGSTSSAGAWAGCSAALAGIAVTIPVTRAAIDFALNDNRSAELPRVTIRD